jgi:hypothetical protein
MGLWDPAHLVQDLCCSYMNACHLRPQDRLQKQCPVRQVVNIAFGKTSPRAEAMHKR